MIKTIIVSLFLICLIFTAKDCQVNPYNNNINLVNTVNQIQYFDLNDFIQGDGLIFSVSDTDYISVRQTIHEQDNYVYTDTPYQKINGATYQHPDQIQIYFTLLQLDTTLSEYHVFLGVSDSNHSPQFKEIYKFPQKDTGIQIQCTDLEIVSPDLIVVGCVQSITTAQLQLKNFFILIDPVKVQQKNYTFDNYPYNNVQYSQLQTLYSSQSNQVYLISGFPNYLIQNQTEKEQKSQLQIYTLLSLNDLTFTLNVTGADLDYGQNALYINDFQGYQGSVYLVDNSSTVTYFQIMNAKVGLHKTIIYLALHQQAFALNVVRPSDSEIDVFIQYQDNLVQYFITNDHRSDITFTFNSTITKKDIQILLGYSLNYITTLMGTTLTIFQRPFSMQLIGEQQPIYYQMFDVQYSFMSLTDSIISCYQQNVSNYLISRATLMIKPKENSQEIKQMTIKGTSVSMNICIATVNVFINKDQKNQTLVPSGRIFNYNQTAYDSKQLWYKTIVAGDYFLGPSIKIMLETSDKEVGIYFYNRQYNLQIPGQDQILNQFITVPQVENVEELYINSGRGFLSCSDNNTNIECHKVNASFSGYLLSSYVNQFGTSMLMVITNGQNQLSLYKQTPTSITLMDVLEFGDNYKQFQLVRYQSNWIHFKNDIFIAIMTNIGDQSEVAVYTNGRVDIVINNATVAEWPGFNNKSLNFKPINVQTTQYLPYILMIDCEDNTLFVSLLGHKAQYVNVIAKQKDIQNCKPFLFNQSLVLVKKINDQVQMEEYSLQNVNSPVLVQIYQTFDYNLIINGQMLVQKSDQTNSLYFLALQQIDQQTQNLVILVFQVNKPYFQTLYKAQVIVKNFILEPRYPVKIMVSFSNVLKMNLNNDVRDYILIAFNNQSILYKGLPKDKFYIIQSQPSQTPATDTYVKKFQCWAIFNGSDQTSVEKQFETILYHNQTYVETNKDGIKNSGIKSVMNQNGAQKSFSFQPDQWFYGSYLSIGLETQYETGDRIEIVNQLQMNDVSKTGWNSKKIVSSIFDYNLKFMYVLNVNNHVLRINQQLNQVGPAIELLTVSVPCFKLVPGYNDEQNLTFIYVFCGGSQVVGVDLLVNNITYPLTLPSLELYETLGYIQAKDAKLFVQKISDQSQVSCYLMLFRNNITLINATYNSTTLESEGLNIINFQVVQTNRSSTFRKIFMTTNIQNKILILNIDSANYQTVVYKEFIDIQEKLINLDMFYNYLTVNYQISIIHIPQYDKESSTELFETLLLTSNTAIYYFNMTFEFISGNKFSNFKSLQFNQAYNNYGQELIPRIHESSFANPFEFYVQSSGISHYKNLFMVVYEDRNISQNQFYPVMYDLNKKRGSLLSSMSGGFRIKPKSQDFQVYTFIEQPNGTISVLSDNIDISNIAIINYQNQITINLYPKNDKFNNEAIIYSDSIYSFGVVPQFSAQISYQSANPQPNNPSSTKTWVIVVIVLASLAVIALGVFFFVRYRKQQKNKDALLGTKEPFESVYSEQK